jgi:4-amino-4-deoxy-L-arabinose transferase-like glycosyltransferase
MTNNQTPSSRWPAWLAVITPFVLTIALRLYIIPTSRMPFDSDEAIFVLMARHILQGERPIFFYGEAYGGSTDSYLTALFYAIFNESITVTRLVQTAEYMVGMLFTFLLARRLLPGNSRFGPIALLWLMALPPLLMTTWTTPAVLYAVVIGLGSIITYLGHRLLLEDADRLWRWLLFGAVCGISFWTFGLLVVYMVPVFALFLWRFSRKRLHLYVLSAGMFFLFSLPWWTEALAGLLVVYNPEQPTPLPPLWLRTFAFFAITLPGFIGIRQPWAPEIVWPALALPLLLFYLAAVLYAIPWLRRNDIAAPQTEPLGFALLGLQIVTWLGLYFGTRFSLDATGRYILPLYPVLLIAVALLLERIFYWRKAAAISILGLVLAFNLALHLTVVQTVPPGITAQMNPALMLGNKHDPALIEFVKQQGGRGYSHHWISYKIAVLSDESVILASFLPFRPDLRWNSLDDRYAP